VSPGGVSGAVVGLCAFAALWAARRGLRERRAEAFRRLCVAVEQPERASFAGPAWLHRGDVLIRNAAITAAAAVVGAHLVGVLGLVAGGATGAVIPRIRRKGAERRRAEALERQLAEVAEAAALAVRSGLSVSQALDFAGGEVGEPMAGIMGRLGGIQRLGSSFEEALEHMGDELGTEDARLFVLVVGIHARSGGNLAGALDEVTSTIRHRIAVRRELRALSAQGRISGTILGFLPIAFFLVLAGTSHRDLGPVYRSPVGLGMVSGGLVMEGLAYLWIRRILRIHA